MSVQCANLIDALLCIYVAFNYLSSQGYTFLVVADDAYGRAIPFAFVERVRDEWFAKWADKGASASAHSLDKSFGYVLI